MKTVKVITTPDGWEVQFLGTGLVPIQEYTRSEASRMLEDVVNWCKRS